MLLFVLLFSMQPFIARAQTSLPPAVATNPLRYISDYAQRAQPITTSLHEKSSVAIVALERAERRLIVKLSKKDSSAARAIAAGMGPRYAAFRQLLHDSSGIDPLRQYYLAPLDSAVVVARLLQLAGLSDKQRATLSALQGELGALQQALTRTHVLQQVFAGRLLALKAGVGGIVPLRALNKMTKGMARYKTRLQELRAWAHEPDRALTALLATLSGTSLFKRLFERYSILASIVPQASAISTDPLQAGSLQVRQVVMTAVDRTAGVTNLTPLVQQKGDQTVNPLQQLKDKVKSLRQDRVLADPTDDIATQPRSKPLHKRLELGTSFQTVRSNNYFPATSDLGLSLGFRLNDRSVIGVGASYKLGWGKHVRAIRLSHEGISFRSFLQAKIKGSFHATGGWEYHYQQPFNDFRSLPDTRTWRQSALLGVMKRVNTGNRVLKSTQFQLLVDMLAINTVHSPILFRVGYQFNQ